MKDRQKILDIIRALRAKTVGNAATEAEAAAAAAKAAELLERYGIRTDELEEAPKDEFVSEEFRSDREVVSARLWRVANAIGKLTGDDVTWLGDPVQAGERDERPARSGRGGRRSEGKGEGRSESRGEPRRAARDEEAAPEAVDASEAPVRSEEPRSENRRSGGRKPRPAAPEEAAADLSARPVRQGEESRRPVPRSPAPPRPERGQRRPDRDDGERVIGLGDHVPQFLLRPVRAPSS